MNQFYPNIQIPRPPPSLDTETHSNTEITVICSWTSNSFCFGFILPQYLGFPKKTFWVCFTPCSTISFSILFISYRSGVVYLTLSPTYISRSFRLLNRSWSCRKLHRSIKAYFTADRYKEDLETKISKVSNSC